MDIPKSRSPHHMLGHMATYMLRQKWKRLDGFKKFMKVAAKMNADGYVPQSTSTSTLYEANLSSNGKQASKRRIN